MTNYEIISIVMSSIALLVSVGSIIYHHYRVNKIERGSIELYINERITNTKEKVSELSIAMSPFLKEEKTQLENAQLEIYAKAFSSATENNLNAYEEACSKYIDGKVDKGRFRKTYHIEIRRLLENRSLKKYFDPLTTNYKAILKVYNEWHNLER